MDRTPGSRFLEVGDGAYVALTRALRGALDDLRTFTAPFRGGLRLHPLAAPALSDLAERATLTADAAWRDRLGKWREAQAGEPETPGTLRGELRPYQVDGFRWLARLADLGAGACLADDMGLGKTVQALALLLRRAPDGPALVVAPTSVVANWFAEARRFAPTLNVATYDGPAADRKRRLEGLGAFDLVLATYGVLQVDAEKLAEVEWSTVMLDEAQAIKNPATKRARAARGLKAGFRLVTTGTPIQNNVLDLYSLFAFLSPGMLGSLNRFRRRFALPIERDGDADARARLRRLTAPFILRRLKSDVLDDLPPRTEITHHVELSPEEAALYEALRQRGAGGSRRPVRRRHGAGTGADAGARPPDPAAARLLQPGARGARGGAAKLEDEGVRRDPRRTEAQRPQGARLLAVRSAPASHRGPPRADRRPLPVPRREARRRSRGPSESPPSRQAWATRS